MITVLSAGRDSPGELRTRLAMTPDEQRELLRTSAPGIGEMAVLCTCHRTELYVTSDGPDSEVVHAMASLLRLRPTDHHDLRFLQGIEAVEHLFRVACGLDSLVIGEPQVLGQVRRALNMAREQGAGGPVLTNLFGRALALGRRARSSGPLGRLGLSIGAIAADHLVHRFGGLEGRAGAIVGAGEAAEDAAVSLRKHGARLAVVSRSPGSARRLAERVDAEAFVLTQMPEVLARSEFAVVAVSGGVAVGQEHLPRRTVERPFVVVDLSTPASVSAPARQDVEVRTLEELPGPRGPEVTEAIIDAEALVAKELAGLARWAETRSYGETIRDLRLRAEAIVREEVARTIGGLDLSPEDAERVTVLGMRIANKLLHAPSVALRDGDDTTRDVIERIFGLRDTSWEQPPADSVDPDAS